MRFCLLKSYRFIKKCFLPIFIVTILAQGCVSNSQKDKRLDRYQPVVAHRSYQAPQKAKHPATKSKQNKPVKTVKANSQNKTEKTPVAMTTPVAAPVPVAVKKPVIIPAVTPATGYGNNDTVTTQRMRKLKYGDMITVGLYGIPEPAEIKESIDNFGCVSLPLIDVIKIVGLGTSDAEKKIRDAYINSGFYTDLSVVVMAMADEYFIRGEVKKVGNYPLIGDRTLLQAITAAGGYTDYAKTSKVTILRNNENPVVFNCQKIAKRRIPDPLIHPGDIIIIPRRILWK